MKCSQITELFYLCYIYKLHLLLSYKPQTKGGYASHATALFPRVMSSLEFGSLLIL